MAALLLLLLDAAARADDEFARPGLYATAGLLLGFENYASLDELNRRQAVAATQPTPAGAGPVFTRQYSATTFLGYSLGAGWRLHPRIALEASFDAANADLIADVTDSSDPTRPVRRQQQRAELSTWLTILQTKLYVSTGRLQPFVLAGIGAMKATPVDRFGVLRESHGFTARVGAGLDAYITERVFVDGHASYAFATGDTRYSQLTTVVIAVGYRFGPPPGLSAER